jgi:DNA-directed RNA polymerase specialized sigma subunit
MKVFSTILTESRSETFALTGEEFKKYCEAIEATKRSKEFLNLLWIISKNPELLDREKVEYLIKGKNVCKIVSADDVKAFIAYAKRVGDEIKLLPQLLSAYQREAVIAKKIDPNDLTLDLETERGRNAIAKKYIPLIEKLVKQFEGKSALSKEEIRSAAMTGLVNAMNDYKNPEEMEKAGKEGNLSFTSYAAYRIKQQILKDIDNFSRDVKISKYYQGKLKDEGEDTNREFSIDALFANDDDDKAMSVDRFFQLSDEDNSLEMREKEEMYAKLFKRIESKFSSRDCIVLYKVWGVNGHNKEKVKDIAKELGISSPAIVQICNRIIKFIANDKYCQDLHKAYESLVDDYVIGKLFEVYKEDRNTIIESFLFDDLYILLEELNKFNNKDKFQKIVNTATDDLNVDDALYIYNILQNKSMLDEKGLKKHKGAVIKFLENVYPDKTFRKASVNDLINELDDLKAVSLKFAIIW